MPTTHVFNEDQTVAFQDEGTGATVPFADPVSAGLFAGSQWEGSFVHHGLEIVTGTGVIGVNRGVALLEYTGTVFVQTNPRDDFDREWRGPAAFPVSVPSVSNLSLDANVDNDLWLAVDLAEANHVEYHLGENITPPPSPRLHIATINESTNEVTRHSDWRPAESKFGPRDVRTLKVGEDEEGVMEYHNGAGGNTEGPAMWDGEKFVSLVDSTTIED